MHKVINTIYKLSEYSGKLFSYLVWIGAIMLAWEVAARYFFNAPTVWAHGYSQRIFGSYFILIGAFTLLKGGHVRIDIIINKFGFRTRKLFDMFNYSVLLLWTSVLLREGWIYFARSFEIKEVDEMVLAHPVYPIKFLLVLGALLITLQGGAMLLTSLVSLVKGEEYEP